MATVSQLNPYQCDHCGTANIVAAPVLYQQGTRAYSGTFSSGTSQSYSAQAAAPPSPRGYVRPLLLWGPVISFCLCGRIAGFRSILELSNVTMHSAGLCAAVFLLLDVVSLVGYALQFSQDRPLQSRDLSSPPLELGAYLYLQALREAPFDPFLGATSLGLLGRNDSTSYFADDARAECLMPFSRFCLKRTLRHRSRSLLISEIEQLG